MRPRWGQGTASHTPSPVLDGCKVGRLLQSCVQLRRAQASSGCRRRAREVRLGKATLGMYHMLPVGELSHGFPADQRDVALVAQGFHGRNEFRAEGVVDAFVNQRIVMGTAELSSLVHLQLQSLANAGVQHRCIQTLVEEDRALAVKLQGHRRERPRAARGHVLGDLAAAREDEVVGALVDQAMHSVLVALLDPDVAIQVLLAQSAEQGRHVGHRRHRLLPNSC
mmetsp:Transcript_121090/g.387674  ORF Transcript_121090/g.387674 Transcript_121090/m.387674 type:complete len:224 (-) Transcript_121090:122-793(-)